MTYPPGSPGYPSAQQPQYGAPAQQMSKLPDTGIHSAEGSSKLPLYLTAAVAVLGLAIYLASFLDLWDVDGMGASAPGLVTGLLDFAIVAGIVAGLLAGVALLPKQAVTTGAISVLATLGLLLVIYGVLVTPDGVSVGLGLWLLLVFTLLQAAIAVTVLLFDSGVVAPPVSQPKYDPQQYGGQYGAPGYYGQQYGGQPQQAQAPQQRPGYPGQYGGGYPSTGGFPAAGSQGGAQGSSQGTPTPPTGFPSYGQPQSPGAHQSQSTSSTQPPQSGQQHASGPQSGQSPSSSPQSGQSPS